MWLYSMLERILHANIQLQEFLMQNHMTEKNEIIWTPSNMVLLTKLLKIFLHSIQVYLINKTRWCSNIFLLCGEKHKKYIILKQVLFSEVVSVFNFSTKKGSNIDQMKKLI